MGEKDNLEIELISKDDGIDAIIPVMGEFSIDPDIQSKIVSAILNCKTSITVY